MYGQKKYIEAKEALYRYIRFGCIVAALYAAVFTLDLLLPFKKSHEVLVRREKIAHMSVRGSGNPYYYWVTNDFTIQVPENFYYAFRAGAVTDLHYTPLIRKVFKIAYNLEGKKLV